MLLGFLTVVIMLLVAYAYLHAMISVRHGWGKESLVGSIRSSRMWARGTAAAGQMAPRPGFGAKPVMNSAWSPTTK